MSFFAKQHVHLHDVMFFSKCLLQHAYYISSLNISLPPSLLWDFCLCSSNPNLWSVVTILPNFAFSAILVEFRRNQISKILSKILKITNYQSHEGIESKYFISTKFPYWSKPPKEKMISALNYYLDHKFFRSLATIKQ